MRHLTMTSGRRAQFARIARGRFNRHEAKLAPAIKGALDTYLELCQQRVAAHLGLQSLQAAANPDQAPAAAAWTARDTAALAAVLTEAQDSWTPILTTQIMPTYQRVLDEVLQAGLNDPRVSADLTAWRNNWLATRQQELVHIPDAVTSQLRTQLQTLAEQNGTSVDDARAAAQTVLDTGYPSWTGRAQLIARTETVGANNQGSLASWSAMADATSTPATKTWLATEDAKTRPEHMAINGTSVPIKDSFDVGGTPMNGPGDPDGGPDQVCNCRCTLTYDFPEGDPSADDQAALDEEGLTAAADVAQSGVAVMLGVAPDDVARCAAPGVDVDPPGLHCTVAYLSEPAASYSTEVKTAVVQAMASLDPGPAVTADAFATSHFNPDSDERQPCAVLLVQSPQLQDYHDAVVAALEQAGVQLSTTFPTWIPHVAIAYDADPSVIPADALGDVHFDRLVVGWGDEQIVAAGAGAQDAPSPDPAGQTGDDLTAATEAPVTAPEAPTDAPATGDPTQATGGDTPAPDAAAGDLTPHGPTWSGVIAELGSPSADGRIIDPAGLVVRPLPLPLSWQRESDDEHDGSVEVGRVLAVEIRGTQLWATGDYYDPMVMYDAQQAMAKVDAGMGLVSVDLALRAVGYADETGAMLDPSLADPDQEVYAVALESEFGGVTLVSFPAFPTARIANDPLPDGAVPDDGMMIGEPYMPSTFAAEDGAPAIVSPDGTAVHLPDGTQVAVGDAISFDPGDGTTDTGVVTAMDADAQTVTITPDLDDDDNGVQPPDVTVPVAQLSPVGSTPETAPAAVDGAMALLASSTVRPYTRAFFNERKLAGPTPLTVVPETGEVYGHLATWGECHIGKLAESGNCVTAPTSKTGYSDFHLAPVLTDEGPLDIGKITVGTGHAMPGGGFANATAHYDNTGTAVAVVRAYEDAYGIQVTGQLVHDVPGPKVEELMRSPLSGDWRARNGNLELCAALAVNTPGFPVRRPTPVVGTNPAYGQLSLVAAGVVEPRSTTPDHIVLPGGTSISTGDMDALVAAMTTAIERHRAVKPDGDAERLALRKARAKLALAAH